MLLTLSTHMPKAAKSTSGSVRTLNFKSRRSIYQPGWTCFYLSWQSKLSSFTMALQKAKRERVTVARWYVCTFSTLFTVSLSRLDKPY